MNWADRPASREAGRPACRSVAVTTAVAMTVPVAMTVAVAMPVAVAMTVTMTVTAAMAVHFDRFGARRGGDGRHGLSGQRGGFGGLAAGNGGGCNTTGKGGEENATIQHGISPCDGVGRSD